jgi:hypothetical protein
MLLTCTCVFEINAGLQVRFQSFHASRLRNIAMYFWRRISSRSACPDSDAPMSGSVIEYRVSWQASPASAALRAAVALPSAYCASAMMNRVSAQVTIGWLNAGLPKPVAARLYAVVPGSLPGVPGGEPMYWPAFVSVPGL